MKGSAVIKGVGAALLFVFCMALVVIGQARRGAIWLGVMLLGLAGLLVLLYLYNRIYTRADRLAARRGRGVGRRFRRSGE